MLPIGIQNFRKLREGNFLYVDKTKWIYSLTQSAGYFFLSRPRRFGKSLLISTLQELFLGNEKLFKGLWIEGKYEFVPYPVIHIAFNNIGYNDLGLAEAIEKSLAKNATNYGIELKEKGIALQLRELIESLASKGKQAVVLIDEYDKPIIDYLDDVPQASINRDILKNFFSILKEADPYLRFVLITGVSKFSKVSIFSDLNNLRDITLSRSFNSIVGYTQSELEDAFEEQIDALKTDLNISRETLLIRIKEWYNGYNWTGQERLYNPFSVLNLFEGGQFHNFWFTTGTPTFLVKLLRDNWHYRLDELEAGSVLLDNLNIEAPDFRSLLFQTGYLTIKNQPYVDLYTLDYPNREVKASLLQYLIGSFSHRQAGDASPMIVKLKRSIDTGDISLFISQIDSLFASIPEKIFRDKTEAAYHSVIYTSLSLLGYYIEAEVASGNGYVDAVIKTEDRIYVVEFKVGYSAKAAIEQIREKAYAEPFRHDGRAVILLGINFGKERKGVAEWLEESL